LTSSEAKCFPSWRTCRLHPLHSWFSAPVRPRFVVTSSRPAVALRFRHSFRQACKIDPQMSRIQRRFGAHASHDQATVQCLSWARKCYGLEIQAIAFRLASTLTERRQIRISGQSEHSTYCPPFRVVHGAICSSLVSELSAHDINSHLPSQSPSSPILLLWRLSATMPLRLSSGLSTILHGC
jgi:hypothetical protein